MGYSAFDPIALADVRTVKNRINFSGITADVLTVGDVIRYDPSSDQYIRAKADNKTNSNFIGVVESISGTNFVVVYSGEISLPDSVMSTISGYTGAQVFYLSDTNAGKLTTVAPTNPGSIIKPVIITSGSAQDSIPGGVLSTIDGIVVNTEGTAIVGDSSVDLSDVQPVGSVIAFSGNTADIPTGWQICDGGFLDATQYSDLYSVVNNGKLYGFVQTAALTKVSGSATLTQSTLVGTKFYISASASAVDAIECTIISGTVDANGNVSSAEIFVNPLQIAGPSIGTHHDRYLQNSDVARLYNGTELIAVYSLGSVSSQPTKFSKPDMRSRFILGESRGLTGLETSAFSVYRLGRLGGEEIHTLTLPELPIHNHSISIGATLEGTVQTSNTLVLSEAGNHSHYLFGSVGDYNGQDFGNPNLTMHWARNDGGRWDYILRGTFGGVAPSHGRSSFSGSHTHSISGDINVSTAGLTPRVSGTINNSGSSDGHNNVPQHIVMYWIIKIRKDSSAKLYKLGPSGGGAVIAKNTAKRWVRTTGGVGCTVDIGYGQWGITRIGLGNYILTHDLVVDMGTADSNKYIVEATIGHTSAQAGSTRMCIINPYGYGGVTFGVRVYDVIGSTHTDTFGYMNLVVYGGGTAL